MSMSSRPTDRPEAASVKANCAEKVLFPTPPFPDKTSILCLTPASFSETRLTAANQRTRAFSERKLPAKPLPPLHSKNRTAGVNSCKCQQLS